MTWRRQENYLYNRHKFLDTLPIGKRTNCHGVGDEGEPHPRPDDLLDVHVQLVREIPQNAEDDEAGQEARERVDQLESPKKFND